MNAVEAVAGRKEADGRTQSATPVQSDGSVLQKAKMSEPGASATGPAQSNNVCQRKVWIADFLWQTLLLWAGP
ncbi:MAG TPA: hypothetical protein VGQ81_03270, partial [Acidobacteriota bacterium]|nr:hypothetical protein [Acidobacteriota bacterium]